MLNIEEIFTVKNIVIYLISINIVTFLAMFIDKKKGRKRRMENKKNQPYWDWQCWEAQ